MASMRLKYATPCGSSREKLEPTWLPYGAGLYPLSPHSLAESWERQRLPSAAKCVHMTGVGYLPTVEQNQQNNEKIVFFPPFVPVSVYVSHPVHSHLIVLACGCLVYGKDHHNDAFCLPPP